MVKLEVTMTFIFPTYIGDLQCSVHHISSRDLSQATFGTPEMTPYLTISILTSKSSNRGNSNLRFFYLGDLQCGVNHLLNRIRVRHNSEPLK